MRASSGGSHSSPRLSQLSVSSDSTTRSVASIIRVRVCGPGSMLTSLCRSGQLLMSMYPLAGSKSLVHRHTVTPSNSRSMKNLRSTCVPAVFATAHETNDS